MQSALAHPPANTPEFTQQDLEYMRKLGRSTSEKPLLHLVANMLRAVDRPETARERDALAQRLIDMAPTGVEAMVCEFADHPFKLHIAWTIVDRDYRTRVSVPTQEYAVEVYRGYHMMRTFAAGHWAQFCEDNPDILAKITKHLGELAIAVDGEHHTTMYFDVEFAKRIGFYCYYVDKKGRTFVPREDASK